MGYVVVMILVFAHLASMLFIFLILPSVNNRKRKLMQNEGFEFCGGSTPVSAGLRLNDLYVKDDEVYIGTKRENLVPIKIIQLSEIARGAKLVGLEVRYRINGEVKSLRVKGSKNELLTYMDRLGYS